MRIRYLMEISPQCDIISQKANQNRNNNLSNCSASKNDLYNYYNHADTVAQGNIIKRNSVPSGGDIMQGGDPEPYNL